MMARTTVAFLCLVASLYLVDVETQHVYGNCAVGSNCDHCPDSKIKWMRNPQQNSGSGSRFKVCCSNCNKYFFKFNVLQSSYCTCMNIPENTTALVNSLVSNMNNWNITGNCWTGSNCTGCGGSSIINGVKICCPNCNGLGVSLSSLNGVHTCNCQQPLQQQKITGNCLYNQDCRNCTSSSYVNGFRVCCPNCRGYFRTLSSVMSTTHCECGN